MLRSTGLQKVRHDWVTGLNWTVLCLVVQSCPALCDLMDCSLPGSSVLWDSPGKNTGVGCMPSSLSNLGSEPRSPTLQADSLPSEPPGKPRNTRVGSLSLLQGIILTQESNRGLLHCTWILSQLSYQESPVFTIHHCIMHMIKHTTKWKLKIWVQYTPKRRSFILNMKFLSTKSFLSLK